MLVGKALKAEPGLGDKVQLVDGKFEANGDPAYVRAACEGEFETVGWALAWVHNQGSDVEPKLQNLRSINEAALSLKPIPQNMAAENLKLML
ncbi:putative aldo-keto reductase 4 [Cucumis melo var. makuwa]|uniref:Aldo-keto reductase 4 n=1 Tax=Cucumis melo var. makuwa TaxID=1194695 RepID=A0A5A7TN99_CUCMM|nr:putative aldo-keto reductase 4 [Cucumis melo var. makuwa]